jgi:hypothetical protein
MAALPRTRPPLQRPDRRSFLWSLASLGFPSRIPKPEKQSEQVYRFLTPVCEVRMSVQYFASSSTGSFRFRDGLTNRNFCLSANGEQDRDCLERFVGSMAIAQYHFRSRRHSGTPLNLRERVADNRSRQSVFLAPHRPGCSRMPGCPAWTNCAVSRTFLAGCPVCARKSRLCRPHPTSTGCSLYVLSSTNWLGWNSVPTSLL